MCMTDREDNERSFDFDAHRQGAIDVYAKVRNKYQDFAFAIRNILREAIERKQLKVHSIEARAKSLESLGDKAMTPSEEDPNLPKYKNPLKEITDLAAVRVITFFPRTITDVDSSIREQFRVLERVDHTQLLERGERFGYKSIHYLTELKGDRTRLPEYERFTGMVQVDECISPYDHDTVSRAAYGARQGQITRFECLLLAGMGANFLRRHPWNDEWFLGATHARLQRLKDSGIAVGSYSPDGTPDAEAKA
jgi:hypothetical protein